MLTEAEAKTKWCPQLRMGVSEELRDAFNALAVGDEMQMLGNCIGSACMMWQWSQSRYAESGEAWPDGRRGYCGLVANQGKAP